VFALVLHTSMLFAIRSRCIKARRVAYNPSISLK